MGVADTTLRTAKPKDKRYRISVGSNVYLEVMTTGAKVFRMRYLKPSDGKSAIYTLGQYPDIGQVEARELARDVKRLVREGIHPLEYKQQQQAVKAAKRKADGLTFDVVARKWHQERFKAGKWKEDHAETIIRLLENNIFPTIGDIPIVDIDEPMLLDLMQQIVDRGVVSTSKKINQWMNAIFEFAKLRRMIQGNPAEFIAAELPENEVKHNPHLEPEQIPDFLNAIDSTNASETLKIAILLTMHTLVRTSEIRFAMWGEFDLENRAWNIPGERMKTGKPHSIPLSTQVMAYLERLKEISKAQNYLISTRSPHKPMSENAMLSVLYKAGYKGIVTIHGLRGTGSTILNTQKFRPDVIERALAHIEPNKVRKAYNHSEYWEERIVMMQQYSDYLDSLRTGDNVIPINRKA